jgi:serine/threonine protein kinase
MTTLALALDELQLPRRFGQYLLFDKIGEGGMARIYLGRKKVDLGGERLVVVKLILPMLSASEEFCRLIVDEAKLSATLSHRNVVQVTDLGRHQEGLYIAMEYVEGLDLRELLRYCSRSGVAFPVDFALHIVIETLHGLDYAHRKRDDEGHRLEIIHRDVSPSNILLSVEGEVKLCDFGIARAISTGDVLPEEAVQGKAGYMSPEAARGDSIDQRSDVFSAGIVLYELLSGRRVYRGGAGMASVLEQAKAARIPSLPDGGRLREHDLQAIVARALAVDPEERYASAGEMLRDLEGYVIENDLAANPMRLGDWLQEHFGGSIVAHRREWELAAKTMEATGSLPPPVRGSQAPAVKSSIPARRPTPVPPRPAASKAPAPAVAVAETSARPASSSSKVPLILLVALVVAAVVALVLTR